MIESTSRHTTCGIRPSGGEASSRKRQPTSSPKCTVTAAPSRKRQSQKTTSPPTQAQRREARSPAMVSVLVGDGWAERRELQHSKASHQSTSSPNQTSPAVSQRSVGSPKPSTVAHSKLTSHLMVARRTKAPADTSETLEPTPPTTPEGKDGETAREDKATSAPQQVSPDTPYQLTPDTMGKIRGKIGKLQALGDELLEVASRKDSVRHQPSTHPETPAATDEATPSSPTFTLCSSCSEQQPPEGESSVNNTPTKTKDEIIASLKGELVNASREIGVLRRNESDAKTRTEELFREICEMKHDALQLSAARRDFDSHKNLLGSEAAESRERSDSANSTNHEVDEMRAEYYKDHIVLLQGELNEVRDELNFAIVKLKMQALDHEQEKKSIEWERDLKENRLVWDHDQEKDRLNWEHKQELLRLTPLASKLQKELEQVTARLLDCQEDKRMLQEKLEATDRTLRMDIAKLHVQLMELKEEHNADREEWEATQMSEIEVGSPIKNTTCNVCLDKPVNMVFNCGHAKCSECASRLVGLGQGCPDCRAPLNQPQLLFLSVG